MLPNELLSYGILSILIVSTYYDLKYREVSNKLTGIVGLLSLPLIWLQGSPILIPLVFSVVFLGIYALSKELGGADIKVMLPLLFIVPDPIYFILVTSLLGVLYTIILYGTKISWKSNIPHFVPITMTYGMILYNIYI